MSPPESSKEFRVNALNTFVHAFVQYWHLCGYLDGFSDVGPLKLYSFAVHFAEINIIAFCNERDVTLNIPDGCVIKRVAGVYTVPKEEDRWHKTPKGILLKIQRNQLQIDQMCLELGAKYIQVLKKKAFSAVPNCSKQAYLVAPDDTDTEQVSSAKVFVNQGVLKPVSDPLDTNLLPEGFLVNSNLQPVSVELPKGHRMLIHGTCETDKDHGDTFFLAVGNGSLFPQDRPYLIHYHYEPAVKVSFGYFVSPDDLSAQEFLPDKWPKEALVVNTPKLVKNSRQQCSQFLPQMLLSKGIMNVQSLLKRIQTER